MIVRDSLVHEVDVTRFLFDEEIVSIQIIKPAANPGCARRACRSADRDPAHRVGQARRRRTVRHHRRRLRGAHRGRRREGQRDDRTGRRPGPQDARRAPGAARSPRASGSASARPTTPSSSAGSTRCTRGRSTGDYTDGPAPGTATPPPRCARPASSRWTAGCPSTSTMVDRATRSRGPDDEDRTRSHTVPPRLRAARIPARGGRIGLRVPAADPAPGLHPVLQPPAGRRRSGGEVPQGVRATQASASPRCCRCCAGRDPTRTPARRRCATGSASSRSPSTSASTSSTPSSPAGRRRPRSPSGRSSGRWRNWCRSSSARASTSGSTRTPTTSSRTGWRRCASSAGSTPPTSAWCTSPATPSTWAAT